MKMKSGQGTGAALVIGMLVASTACSTPRTGGEINALLDQTMVASLSRQSEGDDVEAYQLARAVADVDPDYEGVQDALMELPQDLQALFSHHVLGSNVAKRQPIDSTWYENVLWYIPDRILDTLDLVSFDVHLGFGIFVDAHVTRAAQLSLGFRAVGGVGWHNQRSLGVQLQGQAASSVLHFGAESYNAISAGSSGVQGGSWGESAMHNPSSGLYLDYKDYWAVGLGVTALFAGVDVDFHPIQLVDLLLGFTTYDLLNDDFASSRRIDMSRTERQLMRSLIRIAGNDEELENYLVYRAMEDGEAEADAADGDAPEAEAPTDDAPEVEDADAHAAGDVPEDDPDTEDPSDS